MIVSEGCSLHLEAPWINLPNSMTRAFQSIIYSRPFRNPLFQLTKHQIILSTIDHQLYMLQNPSELFCTRLFLTWRQRQPMGMTVPFQSSSLSWLSRCQVFSFLSCFCPLPHLLRLLLLLHLQRLSVCWNAHSINMLSTWIFKWAR